MSSDGEWITVRGLHIFIGSGENKQEAIDKVLMKFDSTYLPKSKKYAKITLPKDEYAKLNSAIRSKYADKIPSKDYIFTENHFYLFRYEKKSEKIICAGKIKIEGNEELINKIRSYYGIDE